MIQEKKIYESPTKSSLSRLLRKVGLFFTVTEAAIVLKTPNNNAKKILSRWTKQGWLAHIKRGIYSKLPLEVESSDKFIVEDPWILIPKIYDIAYIGGWSAAEYWGLSEQIFSNICVLSNKHFKLTKEKITKIDFVIYPSSKELQFGLKILWRSGEKVSISDPSRTIIDMLNDARIGGGIEHVIDCFSNYTKSEHFDDGLLINYAKQIRNGAVIKRLGYLSEILIGKGSRLTINCKSLLTKGKAQLDPNLKGKKLITRWQLFVPENLNFEQFYDNT